MTTPTQAAQPVLTDDQIRTIITDAHQSHGAFKTGYGLSLGRAIETAVLSKLRAPVADESLAVQALKAAQNNIAACRPPGSSDPKSPQYDHDAFMWDYYQRAIDSLALASAPVAGEAVYTLRVRGAIQAWTPTAAAFSIPDGEHQLFLSPAALQASPVAGGAAHEPLPGRFKPPFDNCSFRMCDLPGQCRGEGKCHHPVSAAPQAPAGWRWTLHPAGLHPDVYAAAAARDSTEAAPEVAGVTLDGCLETLFRIGEHLGIDYAESRKQPGAPSGVYIKAIEVRVSQAVDATREEAAKLMDQTSRSSGAALIRALKSTPAPTAAEGSQASEAVRNEGLKRARKLPEVKCSHCGLKVVSSCGSTGCPVKDRYADLRALSAQPGAIRNSLIAEPAGNPGELGRAGDAPREDDMLTIAYLAGAQAEKERAALSAQPGAIRNPLIAEPSGNPGELDCAALGAASPEPTP
ncbi:hypothetical protein [Bordetella bronchiseptica]|uniref:hypothetical protein n=1 Tax=Bordetella bronchiseptica TaxID=518 RepID=UPI000529270C|nr:hypothetical protein [Bordetella bronchiseptica]